MPDLTKERGALIQRLQDEAELWQGKKSWTQLTLLLREAAAALTTPAQAVPEGFVLVPVAVLEDASRAIGAFVSDQGWADADMQAMDNLDAYIAQHKAAKAGPAVQGEAQDAARYRALRDSLDPSKMTASRMPAVCDPMNRMLTYTPAGFDAAIDAAMAQGGEK
jgi:hypothetical protein